MVKLEEREYLTHEVGSLRKPNFLLRASANRRLIDEDFKEFHDFFRLIGMEEPPMELMDLLKKSGPEMEKDEDFHLEIKKWRVRLNVLYKESTGLDLIDAGEWIRREMYQHVIESEAVKGIQLLTHVRSFDFNFWRPGVRVSRISYDENEDIYLQEFLWAKEVARKPLKVCITSFNTIAEWTIRGHGDFEKLLFELVEAIYVPEVIKLLKAGAKWIQLDEPALTTHPQHVDVFVDAWNHFTYKIKGYLSDDTVLSLHNCFSDYSLLWPILPELDHLKAITLEFANRDTWMLGVSSHARRAYAEYSKEIRDLYDVGFKARMALGVLPVHTDRITPPELIRDRLLFIKNELIDDPRLVLAAPDCGLRQRSLAVAHQLLRNMVEGARMAREGDDS